MTYLRTTKRRPLVERFWEKVEKTDGCWLWLAAKNRYGYGVIGREDRRGTLLAHRASFELSKGPIPASLVLDHLCRNRLCVNPEHLEPVTLAENLHRGEWLNQANSKKTHCPKGHSYSDDNLYIHTSKRTGTVRRHCKTCRMERANV